MNLSIIQKRAPDDDVIRLVNALDKDLAGYAPEQHHALEIDQIFRANVSFFVAYIDNVAAGCGGLEFFAGFAELKRMYVKPAFRGTPLARSMIAHLEYVALERNHHHIKLETGNKQFAAIRFYQREGFKICGPFGEYLGLSDFAIETSIFMEKAI